MPSSLGSESLHHRRSERRAPSPLGAAGGLFGVCLFLRFPLSRPCLFTHELGLPAIDVCRDLPFDPFTSFLRARKGKGALCLPGRSHLRGRLWLHPVCECGRHGSRYDGAELGRSREISSPSAPHVFDTGKSESPRSLCRHDHQHPHCFLSQGAAEKKEMGFCHHSLRPASLSCADLFTRRMAEPCGYRLRAHPLL